MDTKQCSKCGEVKPVESFNWQIKAKGRRQSACKPCRAISTADYNEKNRETNNAKRREHYADNKESAVAYARAYRELNAETAREACRKSHAKNKSERQKSQKAYRDKNPGLFNAKTKKYKASKLQRTASWANDQLIAAYYKEAKRLEELTGIQFHVDHIIPLQGDLVSGLHVETNLQLLPAHENLGKSNSFDPMTFCA